MVVRKLASTPDTQLTQIKDLLPLVGVSMSDLLNEEPIDIEQAMDVLQVGRDKIVEYTRNDGLPYDKVAGKYQFYRTLILVWRLIRHLGGKHG